MTAEARVIYGPKPGRRWWICLGAFALGGAMAIAEWPKPILHAPTTAGTPSGNLLLDLSAALILLCGLVALLAIIRGVPRLTIDQAGLTYASVFGTRSMPWDRLGRFAIVVAFQRRRGKQTLKAVAPVAISPETSRAARKPFAIPDWFEVPLPTILAEIEMRRGNVAADPATVALPVEPPARPIGISGFRWPWLTAALLAILIAVFVVEQRLALTPGGPGFSPSVGTLISLGGLSRTLLQSGQWYRLLTAPFLHASLVHLIANGIAFALAGYTLERLVGRAWLACIFALGALAGSLGSLLFATPTTVSVGASGAIMAMLLALLVVSARLPSGRLRMGIQVQAARVALPALIPVTQGAAALHVDYGAHFGGALFGLALGALLLRTWRATAPLPRFRIAAQALVAVTAPLFAVAGYAAAQHYTSYEILAGMIPPMQYPHGTQEAVVRADILLATYPRDPRSHLIAAVARAERGDRAGQERELRAGLALAEVEAPTLGLSLANTIRVLLAIALTETGRRPEAVAVAHDACAARGDAAPAPQVVLQLTQSSLCYGMAITPGH